MDEIKHVEGVPRWFSYLIHLRQQRTCKRVGHDDNVRSMDSVCARCGLVIHR